MIPIKIPSIENRKKGVTRSNTELVLKTSGPAGLFNNLPAVSTINHVQRNVHGIIMVNDATHKIPTSFSIMTETCSSATPAPLEPSS